MFGQAENKGAQKDVLRAGNALVGYAIVTPLEVSSIDERRIAESQGEIVTVDVFTGAPALSLKCSLIRCIINGIKFKTFRKTEDQETLPVFKYLLLKRRHCGYCPSFFDIY